MEHVKALEEILKICAESSEYTRRTQAIHDIAMRGLGMTASQREERHNKTAIRSKEYNEAKGVIGSGEAKRQHIVACEKDTGEKYEKQRKIFWR